MNRISFLILSLSAAGATVAASVARATDAGPEMNFLAAPAIPSIGTSQPAIAQSRLKDRMVVVVHEPAACGERLASPRLTIAGSELRLEYERPVVAQGACVATGVFAIRNLPAQPLVLVAAARPVPPAVRVDTNQAALRHTFLGAAAAPVEGRASFTLHQVQHGARMVAVISQPAACGSRLQDSSVAASQEGSALALRYRVAPPAAGENCAALGLFTIDGLARSGLVAKVQSEPILAPKPNSTVQRQAPAPTMSFLAAPAAPVADNLDAAASRRVVSVRRGDILQAIVREPAPCGVRPAAAGFDLNEQLLTIRFRVQKPPEAESSCMAIAMATFHGLPDGEFDVVAETQDDGVANVALAR